ncbi:MAG: transposase [Ectothiorhodospiraceae bacterium]|nr:transposase [Ectothiorhodospiraceae bacterium]
MVAYRRSFVEGGTYFFTAALADRRSDLLVRRVEALRAAIRAVAGEHPFGIEAIVVLPDHLHLVATLPPGDADYPLRMQRIKQRFTRALVRSGLELPHRSDGGRALWQRRYWEHTIRDAHDLRRHIDYVHINPVKHGLVNRVVDWPFSSFHRFVRTGLLPAAWGGEATSRAGPPARSSGPPSFGPIA